MASGDTLAIFTPFANEPADTSNFATLAMVATGGHPILQFDTTTAETAYFTAIMPQNYANTTGVTVYITACTASITNTMGWLVAFERMDAATDLDNAFATNAAGNQTVTAATVPGTSRFPLTLNVAITKGANMDSVVAGDMFRIRITRDVANDSAATDTEILGIEIRET